ncbi:RNA polymerase sigma factor [Putridiphycobacter roseus]|uniref:RNA polymerase sigma factor n=1 Tax=Putridiphycobacter roseus TaxID=2219161 RepID=UPI0021CED104|nr:sigma-70 family RNA polymerase sigma factor [Putridiphycobacter roseus]
MYDKYCDAMYTICLRYTKNTDEAADMLQDAFIKIHEKCDSFNPAYELGGWIKKIVVNTAINHIRQNNKFDIVDSFESFEATLEEPEIFRQEDNSANIQDQLIQILKEIPTGYQTVFNLFVFENLTHKEIANYLEISENTSKTQLFKARKLILKKLQDKKILL